MSSSVKAATIALNSSRMKFSSGHFTIFGCDSRERLHGHNFAVECVIEASVCSDDIFLDYGIFKKEIARLCDFLDERLLLPMHSPWLQIEKSDRQVRCFFNEEEMVFPEQDVRILPLGNITIEALSSWFLERLQHETDLLDFPCISSVDIKVSSSASQQGSVRWSRH